MIDFSDAESKHKPGSTTDLGQGEHDTPHLALVAKAIFADNLQLRISDDSSQWVVCDLSRDKLMLSGREILTDERTRRLRARLAHIVGIEPPRTSTHVVAGPCRSCCTIEAPLLLLLEAVQVVLSRLGW